MARFCKEDGMCKKTPNFDALAIIRVGRLGSLIFHTQRKSGCEDLSLPGPS
jgi:hypothetical protein